LKKCLLLLIAIVLLYNPLALIAPVVPQTGNDGRAHLARIMCFPKCILWGDVDPYYYFGQAYMLYYGTLFYIIASPFYYLSLHLGLSKAFAAVEAYKVASLIVDLMVACYIAKLARLRGSKLLYSLLALLFPTILYARMMGAYPFLLSATLSLLGALELEEGRRRGWLSLSLSILAHPYGVLSDLVVILWLRRVDWMGLLLLLPPLLPLVHGFLVLGYKSPPLVEMGPIALLYSVALLWYVKRFKESKELKLAKYFIWLSILLSIVNTLVLFNLLPSGLAKVLAWRFAFINSTILVLGLAFKELKPLNIRKILLWSVALFFLFQVSLVYEGLPHYSGLKRTITQIDVADDYASPVAWAHAYSYTSATGPFHQGDPVFLNLTMFLEWMGGNYQIPKVLKNLALISGAGTADVVGPCKPMERYLLYPVVKVTILHHCLKKVSTPSMVFKVNPIGMGLKGRLALRATNLIRIYGDARIVLTKDLKPLICKNCTVSLCYRGCDFQLYKYLNMMPDPHKIVSGFEVMNYKPPRELIDFAGKLAKEIEKYVKPLYEPIPYKLSGNVLMFNATQGWYLVMASKVLVHKVIGADRVASTVEGLLLVEVNEPREVKVIYGFPDRPYVYLATLLLYLTLIPLLFREYSAERRS